MPEHLTTSRAYRETATAYCTAMAATHLPWRPLPFATVRTDKLSRQDFGATAATFFQRTASSFTPISGLEQVRPIDRGERIHDVLPGDEQHQSH
jgi:hypothetical protein